MDLIIRRIILFLYLLSLANLGFSQNWEWSTRFGGTGNEALGAMEIDPSGNYIIGGSFSDDFLLGDDLLENLGFSDVFLAKLDSQAQPLWAISGGSNNIDATTVVKVDGEGNIYWLGEFWIEGFFSGDTLYSAPSSKAAFVLKYDPNGNLLWSQSISGTSTKTINDLALDQDNNLYLTGYFEDTLLVQDTFLFAPAAQQLFIIKLNSEGAFLWGQHFGEEGTIRGRRILVDQGGATIVAGHFLGRVSFGNQELESVSTDYDLFVVKFDQAGNPIWAREAKGIHDNICNSLALSEEANVFVSGSFIGEMDLGDGVQISTPGFEDNLFLLKYDSNGNPVWARGLDNTEFNKLSASLDIAMQGQSVIMTGYFRDELKIDQFAIESESLDFNGFLAAFQTADGAAEWLRRVPCSGQLLSSHVLVDQENEISIGGAFLETAFFDNNELLSSGLNDAFLSHFNQMSTAVTEIDEEQFVVEIYPNPVGNQINVSSTLSEFTVKIYNNLGQKIMDSENDKFIDLSTLSAGNYWLRIENATFVKTIPFIKT